MPLRLSPSTITLLVLLANEAGIVQNVRGSRALGQLIVGDIFLEELNSMLSAVAGALGVVTELNALLALLAFGNSE